MKKISVYLVLFIMAIGFSSVSHAQELSIGYQGLIGTGDNFLSGLSLRGWTDRFGYEGTVFYGQADADLGAIADIDADVWLLNAQLMYAIIEKKNSKFYVGADFGYGQYDIEGVIDTDDEFWMGGPLVGAQYSFQGLPELGFNWEVSYEFLSVDNDEYDADLDLDGINVTAGIHYKF